jgi:hypothetical protein
MRVAMYLSGMWVCAGRIKSGIIELGGQKGGSNMRKNSILIVITIAGLMLLFSIPVFAIPMVELKPEFQEVKIGESVNVAVVISGLGTSEAPSLGGFDLLFGFINCLKIVYTLCCIFCSFVIIV